MEGAADSGAGFAPREHRELRFFPAGRESLIGPAKDAGPQDDTSLEVCDTVTTEAYGFDYAED